VALEQTMNRPQLAPLLRVEGLRHHFGGVEVLRDVSFALGEGSLTGLIGPNGAGKTTLFNVITGLLQPEHGSVRLGDQELIGRAPHDIANFGVSRTFQNLRLFPEMQLVDNVIAGMHLRYGYGVLDALRRSPRMRAAEASCQTEATRLLDLLGLRAQASTLAGELSYGAQRRLEIARALASDPALLLLDEPVAGMNPRESADLLACIRTLRDAGHAVLLIEHDMGFVMELCEQLFVLNFGALIAQGDPEEIRSNPAVIEAYLGRGVQVP
jgi:branched-chain amino acid transport system ATP-binding protein